MIKNRKQCQYLPETRIKAGKKHIRIMFWTLNEDDLSPIFPKPYAYWYRPFAIIIEGDTPQSNPKISFDNRNKDRDKKIKSPREQNKQIVQCWIVKEMAFNYGKKPILFLFFFYLSGRFSMELPNGFCVCVCINWDRRRH